MSAEPSPFHVLRQGVEQPERPEQPARRLPRRVERIELPEPYQQFHILAWINHPQSFAAELKSGDEDRIAAVMVRIVLEHDLVDFDGRDYPQPSERAFWDAIPTDLAVIILRTVNEQVGKLPKASAGR